jgi:alanine racemase
MIPTPGWVEIDVDAVEHNLGVLHGRFRAGTEVCAVLKADAYGHGIEHVLPRVMDRGIGTIGVTGNEEALAARFLGFVGRILRVRPALADEIDQARVHYVEEWVGGAEHAEVVARVAQRRGVRIPVHVSINATGLGGDGIELGHRDGGEELRRVLAHPWLRVVGVCSHFPMEDPKDIAQGAAAFQVQSAAVVRALPTTDRRVVRRHCATSFAALTVPETHFDLVRIGAAIYGDTVAPQPTFRPAFALKSRVASVNEYRSGSSVGYDRAHRLTRDTTLAVVPLGYADGLPRSIGGRASVLIRGRRLPVVDRPTMNTLTVDASVLGEVHPGEEVVLFGAQGDERITATHLVLANGHTMADLYAVWGRLHPRIPVRAAASAPHDGVY